MGRQIGHTDWDLTVGTGQSGLNGGPGFWAQIPVTNTKPQTDSKRQRSTNAKTQLIITKTCSLLAKYNYMHYKELTAPSTMIGGCPNTTKTVTCPRYNCLKRTAVPEGAGYLRNENKL